MDRDLDSGRISTLEVERPAEVADRIDSPVRRSHFGIESAAAIGDEDGAPMGFALRNHDSYSRSIDGIHDQPHSGPGRTTSQIHTEKVLEVAGSAGGEIISAGVYHERRALQ